MLNLNTNEYAFNPSICHYKNDFYLMSYRLFSRLDGKHPWQTNWDYGEHGFDKTKFCILRIKLGKISIIKIFNTEIDNFIDCRIIKDPKISNKFICIFNAKVNIKNNFFIGDKTNKLIKLDQVDCFKEQCTLILYREMLIDKDLEFIGPFKVLCKNLSTKMEKNWSTWFYNGKLFVTYGFANGPQKNWFKNIAKIDFLNMEPNYLNVEFCYSLNPTENILFDFNMIQEKYPDFIFSLTTPAIESQKYKHLIAVGHVKIENKVYSNIHTNKFINFINSICPFSHKYYYALFFYTFIYEENLKTFKINNISKLFVVEPCEYSVIFPCGICYVDSYLTISFGDSDKYSKLLFLEEDKIEWVNSINKDWEIIVIKK